MGKRLPLIQPKKASEQLLRRIELSARPSLGVNRQEIDSAVGALRRSPAERRRFVEQPSDFFQSVDMPELAAMQWKPIPLQTAEICTLLMECYVVFNFAEFITAIQHINMAQTVNFVQAVNFELEVNFEVAGANGLVAANTGALAMSSAFL